MRGTPEHVELEKRAGVGSMQPWSEWLPGQAGWKGRLVCQEEEGEGIEDEDGSEDGIGG